jgi:carboxymethylenebutenolidase
VPHIQSVADRFAAAGFVALAPDLYHGQSTTSPDEAGRRMMALNIAEAAKDLRGAAEHLASLDAVAPKKVGVLGFCMGGQLAVFAACENGDRIGAAVDFYGIHPNVQPDFGKLRAPVMCHWGRTDPYIAMAAANGLAAAIRAAGGTCEPHVYDAGHAFFNDARPEAYDAPNAALAWDRTVAFLRSHLV